jgi:hypothetical protein
MNSAYSVNRRSDTLSYGGQWAVMATWAAAGLAPLHAAELMRFPYLNEAFKVVAAIPGSKVNTADDALDSYRVPIDQEFSNAARAAIGNAGVARVEKFRRLGDNWDGEGALAMNSRSLVVMSRFFRDSGLRPEGMATFMLRTGNLAVNWYADHLIELEFKGDGDIGYFFERDGSEGVADAASVIGMITALQRAVA